MIFEIDPHAGVDKSFQIRELEVDYDDVDHEEQDLLSRQVVRVLNDHWNDPEYDFAREWNEFRRKRLE